MREAARAVKALCLETSVSKHLDDLGIFLALLFEDEFALLVVVLVLTPTSVLATLLYLLACLCWGMKAHGGEAGDVLCDCVDVCDVSVAAHSRVSSRRERWRGSPSNGESTHFSLILRHIVLWLRFACL